jgi:hypothetical protein
MCVSVGVGVCGVLCEPNPFRSIIISLYHPSSVVLIILPTNCRLSCISLREKGQESRLPKSQDGCRPGPCLTTWSWRAVRQEALSRFTNPGRGCHARPWLLCMFGPRCRGKYTHAATSEDPVYCHQVLPIAPSSPSLHPNRIPATYRN